MPGAATANAPQRGAGNCTLYRSRARRPRRRRATMRRPRGCSTCRRSRGGAREAASGGGGRGLWGTNEAEARTEVRWLAHTSDRFDGACCGTSKLIGGFVPCRTRRAQACSKQGALSSQRAGHNITQEGQGHRIARDWSYSPHRSTEHRRRRGCMGARVLAWPSVLLNDPHSVVTRSSEPGGEAREGSHRILGQIHELQARFGEAQRAGGVDEPGSHKERDGKPADHLHGHF